jgi:hypothetical protein
MEATAAHVAVVATTGKAASVAAASEAVSVAATTITITGPAISVSRASIVSATVAVPAAVAVEAAISVSITTIPGTGADKETAGKPRRAVVSVGSAGIRIIAVIAVSANGSSIAVTPIHRCTDPNSNRNLSMGISRSGEQHDTE